MNAPEGALAGCAASYAFALIANAAARKRSLALGSLPRAVPLAAAACGAALAAAGAALALPVACAGVAVAGWADGRTGFIFDPLVFTLLAATGTLRAFDGDVAGALTGAFVATGVLGCLYVATRGRGIGLGDVKLAAVSGMALGWEAGLAALATAFVLGGAYGAWLLATQRARIGTSIRFGPFIAAGAWALAFTPRTWLP